MMQAMCVVTLKTAPVLGMLKMCSRWEMPVDTATIQQTFLLRNLLHLFVRKLARALLVMACCFCEKQQAGMRSWAALSNGSNLDWHYGAYSGIGTSLIFAGRFRLVPIPGHSLLSERVINRVRHSRRDFTRVQLQGGHRLPVSSTDLHRLPPPTQRPGLICEDISGGLEKVHPTLPRRR